MSDHSKHDLHEHRGVGQRIGDALARSMPTDADAITRKSWIERRLQTIMIGALASAMGGLIVTVVIVFAAVPSDIRELKNSVRDQSITLSGAYRADDARRELADLRARGTGRDEKDASHDAALDTLSHRLDRVEYVIEVAPATAPYTRTRAAAAAGQRP